MKKDKRLFTGLLLSAIALVVFGSTFFIYRRNAHQADDGLTVVTSFYPMYLAAQNVTDGAQGVRLCNLSEPQTGCLHDYQLTSGDRRLLASADVFIVNGGGIETFLSEVAKDCPNLLVIDAGEGIGRIGDNAHLWMSVKRYRQQIVQIAAQLEKADPARADLYRTNAEAYCKKLESLLEREESIREKAQGRGVILFHEAFAYLADDLGLPVEFVMDLDEERQVSAVETADMLAAAQGGLILAEETYGKEMGDLAQAESGATCLYLDPLVRGSYEKDAYLKGMERNLDLLEQTVGTGKEGL